MKLGDLILDTGASYTKQLADFLKRGKPHWVTLHYESLKLNGRCEIEGCKCHVVDMLKDQSVRKQAIEKNKLWLEKHEIRSKRPK